jgi:hypothetical protein
MRIKGGLRRYALWLGLACLLVLGSAPSASAGHWYANGWRDWHYNYPPKPYGYNQIVAVFGQPCNSESRANVMRWMAADTGTVYNVVFHRKLGGSTSTNLDNDVRGHIGNGHMDNRVWHGIWGYNCRFISYTTKYSTHSWGIAIDQNSAYEHVNHYHSHTVCTCVADQFNNHGWRWGINFGDAMHFQYAYNY